MKNLIIVIVLTVTQALTAQSNYDKGMQEAFKLWGSNPMEASNLFERIAAAESENWVPLYYAAQINILQSFGVNDQTTLEAQLNKAQNLINDATLLTKDNPEIMVLQALLHTAWVAFDGATYGMTLSPRVSAIYSEAQQLAPDNPRVVLSKAEWDMGSARYFGQDTTPYCKDVERSIELFANFKPESAYHPKWGLERANQILESCKK